MAANDLENLEKQSKVTRCRELFRGRFTRQELERALENHGWEQDETIAFLLESEPRIVRQLLNTRQEDYITNIQSDLDLVNNAKIRKIPTQRRQFACRDCDHSWWQRVPSRKMVSKCRKCQRKFDPVPREDEWGWADFTCVTCGNQFSGFGHMNRTLSACYQCGTLVPPTSIRPPENRGGQPRSSHRHSCSGCSGHGGGGGGCVHPQTRPRRVIVGSSLHVSTGSTVNSIISDDVSSVSGRSRSSRAPSVGSIPEDDENNHGNGE